MPNTTKHPANACPHEAESTDFYYSLLAIYLIQLVINGYYLLPVITNLLLVINGYNYLLLSFTNFYKSL